MATVLTFSTGDFDPCPIEATIPEFVKPYLADGPKTVHELVALLADWFPEGEAPSYGQVYESLLRDPSVTSIKRPGKRSRWVLANDKEG